MARKIPPMIQRILSETRSELQAIYSNRFKELILFGSYARGDFAEDSDIDVLLLLEGIKDQMAEREKYFPLVSRLSLKYDKVLSVVPMDYREFQTRKTPLILNVNREGKRV